MVSKVEKPDLFLGNSLFYCLQNWRLRLGPEDVDGVEVEVAVLDDVTEGKVEELKVIDFYLIVTVGAKEVGHSAKIKTRKSEWDDVTS